MTRRALTILIAGTGRLAKILAEASIRASSLDTVAIVARDRVKRDQLIAEVPGLQPAEPESASRADIVVLAISPDGYRPVLAKLTSHIRPSTVMVSVTNGVSLQDMSRWTPNPIIKVIPTIAQSISRGAVPVVAGPAATSSDVELVKDWLKQFSVPMEVQDEDIRVASNVAGSAIAVFALFGRAFASANAAKTHSIPPNYLDQMIAESFAATAELLSRGYDYDTIINSTATPSGITEALLRPLEAMADVTCAEMVKAAFSRQRELQTTQGV